MGTNDFARDHMPPRLVSGSRTGKAAVGPAVNSSQRRLTRAIADSTSMLDGHLAIQQTHSTNPSAGTGATVSRKRTSHTRARRYTVTLVVEELLSPTHAPPPINSQWTPRSEAKNYADYAHALHRRKARPLRIGGARELFWRTSQEGSPIRSPPRAGPPTCHSARRLSRVG